MDVTGAGDAMLAAGSPLTALESTIISHGMPYPDNVAMATEVEAIIRAQGAVPATIAVLHGKARVGLGAADLELLASSPDVGKVSRRDLPHVMARGGHGATTVAATMRLAALAGIRVFVTGGLGGVHRGAADSFDVSADLTELAQTDVAVVRRRQVDPRHRPHPGHAGDPRRPRRLLGHGRVPRLLQRHSGCGAPLRSDTAEEIVATMRIKWQMGVEGGLVVAQPIGESDEIPAAEISSIIDRALGDMAALRISGKDATPYLLGRIVELTGGRSLRANIALVKNNAVLGARLAAAYAAC